MSQQASHTTPTTFACPAGLRRICEETALWIQSPRTGRRVVIVAGWWAELPARLAARVTRAASQGVRLVPFTRDELAAVAALADRIAAHCRGPAAAPAAAAALHGGWHRRRTASRSFSGHRLLRGRRGA